MPRLWADWLCNRILGYRAWEPRSFNRLSSSAEPMLRLKLMQAGQPNTGYGTQAALDFRWVGWPSEPVTRPPTSARTRLGCSAPWRMRTEAIFGVATRIGTQRYQSAGAAQMSLIAELKRRNVFKVGIAYVVAAWLILQLTDVLSELMELESDVGKIVIILLVVGFIPALIFAWAFELTPDGVKREEDVDRSQSLTRQMDRRFDFAIIGLLAVAVVYFAVDKFVLEAEPEQADVASESVAREKSIAVLPFVNMSADADNEYFSDGLSEELLNLLAKVDGLKVAARTSSFKFKNSEADIAEIGAQLGVATILEGSVRKSGDQARITAQLIKVGDGFHLWSDTYDRTLDDIFQVQDEIARAIVDALKLPLLGHDAKPVTATTTENFAAYDLYLLGRHHAREYNARSFEQAIGYYQRAIGIDPGFAPAYSGLADGYIFLSDYGDLPQGDAQRLAREAVEKALALDPDLVEAQVSMGLLLENLGHYAEADPHFMKALQINPSDVNALMFYSNALTDRYQYSRALEAIERAMEVDPLSHRVRHQYAMRLIRVRRFDAALDVIQALISANPDDPTAYEIWGDLFREQGLPHRSIPMYRTAHRLRPGDIYMARWNVAASLELDDAAMADYWLEQARARGADGQWTRFAEYTVLYADGRSAELLQLVNRVLGLQPGQVILLILRGVAQMQLGQNELALETFHDALAQSGYADGQQLAADQLAAAVQLANALDAAGNAAQRDALLAKIELALGQVSEANPPHVNLLLLAARAASVRGDLPGVLRKLEAARELGFRRHWDLIRDPSFARWQTTPEFMALHQRMLDDAAAMRREYRSNNPDPEFRAVM
jgi:TolB-like protein/predicted Zn-dependent protease